jgi:hypothetical protein
MNKKITIVYGLLTAIILLALVNTPLEKLGVSNVQYKEWFGYYPEEPSRIDVSIKVDLEVWVERIGEKPILWSYHAGVLTNIGKDFIEDMLGDSPQADPAKWLSLSTNSTAPSSSWTQIPNEIVANGLERASATYASTGVGQFTLTHQFTASATHTNVRLGGVQWANSGNNNLLWADTFTPVTLNNGEKITLIATTTIS